MFFMLDTWLVEYVVSKTWVIFYTCCTVLKNMIHGRQFRDVPYCEGVLYPGMLLLDTAVYYIISPPDNVKQEWVL